MEPDDRAPADATSDSESGVSSVSWDSLSDPTSSRSDDVEVWWAEPSERPSWDLWNVPSASADGSGTASCLDEGGSTSESTAEGSSFDLWGLPSASTDGTWTTSSLGSAEDGAEQVSGETVVEGFLDSDHTEEEAGSVPAPIAAASVQASRAAKRRRQQLPPPITSQPQHPAPAAPSNVTGDVSRWMGPQLSCDSAWALLSAPTVQCSGARPHHLVGTYSEFDGLVFKEHARGRRMKGADTWAASGGPKGTSAKRVAAGVRVRRRHGRLSVFGHATRGESEDCPVYFFTYHEFSVELDQAASPNLVAFSNCRLFHILPDKETQQQQQQQQPQPWRPWRPTTSSGGQVQHAEGTALRGHVLSATVGSSKRRRTCTHRGLDFDVAYKLLVGGDPTTCTRRPDHVRATLERQIFVERPPERKRWGECDRWRNSGGLRGGVIVWVNEQHGVRKRYGTVVRAGRPSLGFQHFSLVARDSDADDAAIVEDDSVYVYAVEGCNPDEVEEKQGNGPVRAGRRASQPQSQETTTTAGVAARLTTSGSLVTPAAAAGELEQSFDHSLLARVGQPLSDRADDAVVVLDFMTHPHQHRWKHTFSAVSPSASNLRPSGELPSSSTFSYQCVLPLSMCLSVCVAYTLAGAGTWPLGKTTLAPVSSLMVLAVVALLGVAWLQQKQHMITSSDSASCPVGTYMPPSDLLSDCIACTNCHLRGLVELHACTPERDSMCGVSGPAVDQAALLAIKATQQGEATVTSGGMSQWSMDAFPCTTIDDQGRGWPGCQCDPVDERVVTLSIASGVDITAPMDINLVANLTAVRYISMYGRKLVFGDIQTLSFLVELRWLDLRGTSVHGLISGLASLIHIGECWEPFEGWPSGGGSPCAPLYQGALLLAGSKVYGSVNQLQALPGLGPNWRPDYAAPGSSTPPFLQQGSFSSCASFDACGGLQQIKDAAMYAGVDVTACCVARPLR